MGGLLQIRNVPDEARRALKARAAARGESLNTYLVNLLTRDAATPTVAEVMDRAASRTEQARGSAVDIVLDARNDRQDRLDEPARP